MNCKLIRNGNAFYETDDECMEKKINIIMEIKHRLLITIQQI